MKEICEGCPKLDTCQGFCKEKNELMKKDFGINPWSQETAVSQLGRGDQKESDDEPSIDDFRKIDPGRAFEDVSPNEIEWEQTLPQGKVADLQESEKQLLDDAISRAIPREKTKLKRRFRDFLKCEKMSRIADRAGTTKQNVQKQFQGVIKKAYQILKKRKAATKKIITPYQFKLKLY